MKHLLIVMAALIVFSLTACKDDNNLDNPTAKVELRLTDAPAHYEAVYIDIREIVFKMDGGEDRVFPLIHPGVYDLLELRNGVDVLLGEMDLPVGNLSQIRLILGENNSVRVDGIDHPLHTPSAQQSGLKINVHYDLEPGLVYRIWLDFDAGRSIVERGNGSYGLKPVIRAFTDLTNGMIEGVVLPVEALTTVYALKHAHDTVGVAIPGPDGYFKFQGLPQGFYQLSFDAANPAYQDQLLEHVEVFHGEVTEIEVILVP